MYGTMYGTVVADGEDDRLPARGLAPAHQERRRAKAGLRGRGDPRRVGALHGLGRAPAAPHRALRERCARDRLGPGAGRLRRTVILADTSGVFSALDRSQPGHEAARRIVEAEDVLILSTFVLAELDYLLATRISVTASLELL